MKNKKLYLLQSTVALILIGSWSIYTFYKSDIPEYETAHQMRRTVSDVNMELSHALEMYVRGLERASEKQPKQKVIVDRMKEIHSVRASILNDISYFKNKIVEYDESKWESEQPPIMPLQYNSTEPIETILNQKKFISQHLKQWKTDYEALQAIINAPLELPDIPADSLIVHRKKQQELLDQLELLTYYFSNEEILNNFLSNCDVMHAHLFLSACRNEIIVLTFNLYQNLQRLSELLPPPSIPIDNFIIEMRYKQPPVVGKPFEMDFYSGAYVTNINSNIFLNGKSLEVENGVATFQYAPKTVGAKYFDMEIKLENPFTGKTDSFRERVKREVVR